MSDLLARIDEVLAHPSHFSVAHTAALLADLRELLDATAIPCPEWGELRATALGADLATHDPNGEAWERRWSDDCEWLRGHGRHARDHRYTIRPVAPEPPKVERVPWWEAVGRRLPNGDRIVTARLVDGSVPQVSDGRFPDSPRPCDDAVDADGMVAVLPEGAE